MHGLTLVSLLLPLFSAVSRVAASPCVAMDASFNLFVFGVDGKDFNAGTQDKWTSGSATDVTTSNRPPFDGADTTCYLAQFYNAIYVLNGDKSDPLAVYIYDVGGKSWSKQSTNQPSNGKTLDTSNYKAILDHDTNVFYAMSKGEVLFLNMGAQTSANSSALDWTDVGSASAWGDLSSYNPVMALAQNHIHFINIPNASPGTANIFVIHFSFFQPDAQSYGTDFPQTDGQTASFFQGNGVQQEFAYIPADGSSTYVINVESNTTQTLAGPSVKDANAQYFAGINSLVQLSPSQGSLQFLPYTQGQDNSGASWTKITSVTVTASNSSSNSSSGSGTQSGSGSNPSSTSNSNNSGAEKTHLTAFSALLGVFAVAAVLV